MNDSKSYPADVAHIMQLYNHISEIEKHFNQLEFEYRKLASQWLLVALGAIGYVLTKNPELLPFSVWYLVQGICVATIVGILVIWMLDLKVYHQLLHAAYKEGVALENKYPQVLPPVRTNMANTQVTGDVITRVAAYYFFSVGLMVVVFNIACWFIESLGPIIIWFIHLMSISLLLLLYRYMRNDAQRHFAGINK